jgi:hypothetical protein
MTENVVGFDTYLGRGSATGASLPAFASDTYSRVLDVEEGQPPSASRETEAYRVWDVKSEKKLVGGITYTNFTGTLVRAWGDAIQDSLEDDANSGVAIRRNWKFMFPNTGQQIHYWSGYCSKFEYGAVTSNGRITVSIEIVVDGDVTIIR